MGTSSKWKNRIIGNGDESPDQLAANPLNWRIHPEHQQDALEAVLDGVGWVSGIIVNRQTGFVVDGHLRVAMALRRGEKEVPVQYVDLTEEEERLVLATLDPITAMAGADAEKVRDIIRLLPDQAPGIQTILNSLAKDAGLNPDGSDHYQQTTEAPIYTPSADKPSLAELVDTTRRDQLVEAIEASDLPDDEKSFLRQAAERHVVFHYHKIADYYSQSEAALQSLMEDSALVIIDFAKAIALGYTRLAKGIAKQYKQDRSE